MPYRRLPKTDQARIRTLKDAIKHGEEQSFNDQVFSFALLREAEIFLNIFERQSLLYKQAFENQISGNKKYQIIVSNVRMYISHFIQVLNLAVIRGEVKKELKLLYHLEVETHSVPDLSTEAALVEWGQNLIKGENERIRYGGLPIYNPTIAKVHVHYEMFKEYKSNQRLTQATTQRNWEELVQLREKGDKIILDIWNQVEYHYRNEMPYAKLKKCQQFGLIYYYRRNEKILTPQDDETED